MQKYSAEGKHDMKQTFIKKDCTDKLNRTHTVTPMRHRSKIVKTQKPVKTPDIAGIPKY